LIAFRAVVTRVSVRGVSHLGPQPEGKAAHRQTGSGQADNIVRLVPKHSCHQSGHNDLQSPTGIEPAPASQEIIMPTTDNANQHLIVTAFWEVNSGEEGAVAELLKDFLPQAQREPGVKAFQIHQNVAKPREFFFYEVFAGEAAFADHQQTDHFKNIIVGQAIPKLAKRERSQFHFI
jgi:quinol monooxygenase YgiN